MELTDPSAQQASWMGIAFLLAQTAYHLSLWLIHKQVRRRRRKRRKQPKKEP